MTVLWLNFDLSMFFHEHVFLRFFGFFGPFYDFGCLPRPFLDTQGPTIGVIFFCLRFAFAKIEKKNL